ncbi:GGDEF domain-containing protein [Rhizobium sp. RU36D]|uniref:sensor domain-containing diguanylate cyclase n=1 Tax=Rhizobium sp. RU36D TaxID=1907415 RepID=UPI0009D866DF|nr:GGDEF domain-containing protein [Rhizobium sp. RU36D]SMD07518.1 PAS domain S-box-containing protein/diguanylate cyclase (GGDEF) domain-containing protein [Rhizobium sp. RU36D]
MLPAKSSLPVGQQMAGYDAWWLSSAGTAPPAALVDICDLGIGIQEVPAHPFACFAGVDGESLSACVRRHRSSLGDAAYLVLVFNGSVLPPKATRAIEFGADDVCAADDRDGLTLALARANRVNLERRQTAAIHRALDLERDHMQACIDNLPTPIFFKNERGIYVGCNKAFQDYMGLPASSIIGHTVHDVACGPYASVYHDADLALMKKGGTQVYEAMVHHADGLPRDILFQKAVITDRSGAARGIAGAMLDITERKRLEAKLTDAAARDPLTNIFNRRRFFQLASERVAESLVQGRPVTLAVLDIDHFKSVNDRYGHAMGDRVLCDVADLLDHGIGEGNLVARAGGEEFFALLPGHDQSAASDVMERLRNDVAAMRVEDRGLELTVTISIGLAQLSAGEEDLWACLRRADHALYDAKHGGRNRLSLAA